MHTFNHHSQQWGQLHANAISVHWINFNKNPFDDGRWAMNAEQMIDWWWQQWVFFFSIALSAQHVLRAIHTRCVFCRLWRNIELSTLAEKPRWRRKAVMCLSIQIKSTCSHQWHRYTSFYTHELICNRSLSLAWNYYFFSIAMVHSHSTKQLFMVCAEHENNAQSVCVCARFSCARCFFNSIEHNEISNR